MINSSYKKGKRRLEQILGEEGILYDSSITVFTCPHGYQLSLHGANKYKAKAIKEIHENFLNRGIKND